MEDAGLSQMLRRQKCSLQTQRSHEKIVLGTDFFEHRSWSTGDSSRIFHRSPISWRSPPLWMGLTLKHGTIHSYNNVGCHYRCVTSTSDAMVWRHIIREREICWVCRSGMYMEIREHLTVNPFLCVSPGTELSV